MNIASTVFISDTRIAASIPLIYTKEVARQTASLPFLYA